MTNIIKFNKQKLMGILVFSLFILIGILILVFPLKLISDSEKQALKGWEKGRGWGWI